MWNVSVKLLKYIFNRNIRQVIDYYWFIGSWPVITDRNIDRIYIYIHKNTFAVIGMYNNFVIFFKLCNNYNNSNNNNFNKLNNHCH